MKSLAYDSSTMLLFAVVIFVVSKTPMLAGMVALPSPTQSGVSVSVSCPSSPKGQHWFLISIRRRFLKSVR